MSKGELAWLRGRVQTRDDAGKTCEIRPREWRKTTAWKTERSRATVRRAARLLKPGVLATVGFMVVLIILGYVILSVVNPNWINLPMYVRLGVELAVITIATIGGSLVTYSLSAMRIARAKALMRRRSLCCVCVYELAGIPAAPSDGLTTCPECGARWRTGVPPSPLP